MRKYGSEALMVLHQDAEGLHRLGIISDAEMREFDEDCLVKEPETAYETEKSIKMEQVTVTA
jgi:DNA-binding transcriptional regulator YiaG